MNKRGYALILLVLLFTQTACGQKVTEKSIPNNVYLETENVGGLKESQALERIKAYASQLETEVKEPKVDEVKWEVVGSEQPGKKVNIEKTLESLFSQKEGEKAGLVVEEIPPQNTVQNLKNNIVVLASFSTKLLDQQDSRVNNIEIAAEELDYFKVAPGEEFSFNGALGKRTKAKGYEKAPIIIKTEEGYEKGYGVGGGICQVSSTLFNAVEKCGMQITERHIHTKDVGYVPRGRDATVAYGAADFRFVNNRQYPIMIRTYLAKGILTVKILENRNQ